MIKAALDIGTNSTRLLIVDNSKEEVKILVQKALVTRIGEGLGQDKCIKKIPLERTVRALKEYVKLMDEYAVEDFCLVATSAMRDAVNNKEVIEQIYSETGLDVEIISGEKEAELSYLGASCDFQGDNQVIDIGGGSTEITFLNNGEINFKSVNLGAVRLKEFPELMKNIKAEFELLKIEQKNSKLIGVGGTITTLAAIDLGMEKYDWQKVHGHILSLRRIKEINNQLLEIDLEARKNIPGLQADRADIIAYGIKILIEFMELTKIEDIIVSDKDLLFALAK